jgi:hypothetical protein
MATFWRWVANLVARLHATTALCMGSNPDISKKFTIARHKQRKEWPTHSSPPKKNIQKLEEKQL